MIKETFEIARVIWTDREEVFKEFEIAFEY